MNHLLLYNIIMNAIYTQWCHEYTSFYNLYYSSIVGIILGEKEHKGGYDGNKVK